MRTRPARARRQQYPPRWALPPPETCAAGENDSARAGVRGFAPHDQLPASWKKVKTNDQIAGRKSCRRVEGAIRGRPPGQARARAPAVHARCGHHRDGRRDRLRGDGVEPGESRSVPLPVGAHRYPDLCSQVLSGTRVPTQELPFFGRGSGRIASPAQRERPPTEGRRERVRAHGTPAPCLKPCLPSPGALRAPASRCAPLRGARQCGRYAAVWATCGRPPGQARARAPAVRARCGHPLLRHRIWDAYARFLRRKVLGIPCYKKAVVGPRRRPHDRVGQPHPKAFPDLDRL